MPSRPPQIGNPGGFALGSRTSQSLQAIGINQTAWRWRYSPAIPRPTDSFPPHRALAGDHLEEIPTADGWYPGDHLGCLCVSQPVMRGPDGRFVRV